MKHSVPAFRHVAAAIAILLSWAPSASAYTLSSGFSESCHERLTVRAFAEVLEGIDRIPADVPSGVWEELAEQLRPFLAKSSPTLLKRFDKDAAVRFALLSVVIGVRAPDTSGHSVSDLNALRRIHGAKDREGQYAHALRGLEDDGVPGDLAAIRGTRALIRQKVEEYAMFRRGGIAAGVSKQKFFLDFYGRISVSVATGVFRLGEAIHALQDSHSHTIRDAKGDEILHVLNYVDALTGDSDQARDGWPHSDAMDDCMGPIEVLTDRATLRTVSLVRAAEALSRGDSDPLERGLSACSEADFGSNDCGWLAYHAECEAALKAEDEDEIAELCCTQDNGFCDSPWTEVAAEDQTGPYLGAFACGVHQVASPGRSSGALYLFGLVAVCCCVRRRIRLGALVIFTGLWLAPGNAHAAPEEDRRGAISPAFAPHRFAGTLESHGSLMSDSADASLLNLSMGFGVRLGMRWEQWGGFLLLDRNYWLATDQSFKIHSGAFNAAIGGEYLFFNGLLRTSLAAGVCVLMFDTALDEAGSVGPFVDLRPLGFRFPLAEHFHAVFDPFTATVLRPVVKTPGIAILQYRTVLGLEGHL